MTTMLKLLGPIEEDLSELERELEELVDSNLEPLTDSSSYLLNSGGKRLRPALVLLSGKMFDYDFEKARPLAIAVEFVHMASLVHDDVIDDSDLRRGKEAVNYKWGNKVAVLSGDLLYTFAANSLTKLEDSKYLKHLLEAALGMTRGQASQTVYRRKTTLSFMDYLRVIRHKTALLMGKSCLLGAKASGADEGERARMEKFGLNLGLAFQIADDLKDLIGRRDELGKEPGNDLKEGTLTLPTMIALEEGNRGSFLRKLLRKEDPSEEEIREGIRIIKSSAAVDRTVDYSRLFADKAIESLPEGIACESREALESITRYVSGGEVKGESYLGEAISG
ncbi:MAG: polyprenyl synthetase family protein [Candidatus Acetothermia bacterium]